MTIHHEIYRGPGDLPASRFTCSCGACFEPYATVLLDSHLRNVPYPYGGPRYYQRSTEPYAPYRPLLRWLEEHRGCVVAEGRRTVERGMVIVDRRAPR